MALKAGRSKSKQQASQLNLDDHDFTTKDIDSTPQVCALIFGGGGSGKTTTLTQYAPSPVAIINYDGRDKDAVRRARTNGRVIHRARLLGPRNISRLDLDEAMKRGQDSVDRTILNFEWALREAEKGNIRTIGIDTITEFEEICTVAVRGRLDKAPKDYGASKGIVNRQLWSLFEDARKSQAHFIALSRAKEIWSGGAPSGQYAPRCSSVILDAVDWAGHIRVTGGVTKSGKRKRGSTPKFEMEIKKAGANINELLEVYDEDEWEAFGGPFAMACHMQWPDYDLESWV